MIEIGCNFLKKDLDKIQKFKNPRLDINKNKLNKKCKYKIFLNETQFSNLSDQGFIKLIGWQAYRGDQIHRKNCLT